MIVTSCMFVPCRTHSNNHKNHIFNTWCMQVRNCFISTKHKVLSIYARAILPGEQNYRYTFCMDLTFLRVHLCIHMYSVHTCMHADLQCTSLNTHKSTKQNRNEMPNSIMPSSKAESPIYNILQRTLGQYQTNSLRYAWYFKEHWLVAFLAMV